MPPVSPTSRSSRCSARMLKATIACLMAGSATLACTMKPFQSSWSKYMLRLGAVLMQKYSRARTSPGDTFRVEKANPLAGFGSRATS